MTSVTITYYDFFSLFYYNHGSITHNIVLGGQQIAYSSCFYLNLDWKDFATFFIIIPPYYSEINKIKLDLLIPQDP